MRNKEFIEWMDGKGWKTAPGFNARWAEIGWNEAWTIQLEKIVQLQDRIDFLNDYIRNFQDRLLKQNLDHQDIYYKLVKLAGYLEEILPPKKG